MPSKKKRKRRKPKLSFHLAQLRKAAHVARSRQLAIYATLELLKNSTSTKSDILSNLEEVEEWELVEEGDDVDGDRKSTPDNPTKCECGTDWTANYKIEYFNQKPTQKDITNCYDAIDYPKLGKCDEPCVPVQTFKGKYYSIRKNKKTGEFKLYCSKRVQWHCERQAVP